MPKLTVLMPVYNAEKFLTEAIDSILKQTFSDFEFIIIDDCSTDSSVAIIQSFNDSRIRFYQNVQNRGISFTLNRGIELATAEYIARMDSDDISYPERLQRQFDFINKHPDGALYSCWARVVDEEGHFLRQDIFESDYYYYNLTFICWIYHPTVIYRKNAVQEVGGYKVAYSEDYELFWQLTRRYKHYNLPEVLLDYRVTSQSLHQVVKKQEYELAQQEQLLRNLRFYTQPTYTLPESYIACFRHNFQPLLEQQSVSEIVKCLGELKYITNGILAKPNVNHDPDAIKKAAHYKQEFIISNFVRSLPRLKAIFLLIKLGRFSFFIQTGLRHILARFKLLRSNLLRIHMKASDS